MFVKALMEIKLSNSLLKLRVLERKNDSFPERLQQMMITELIFMESIIVTRQIC